METHEMAGHLIRRLHQLSTQVFTACIRDAGFDITSVQFAALDAIRLHPGIDQAGVAALIAYDRPTIGEVLNRLIAKGLVERSVSTVDKRARVLRLTAAGDALFNGLLPVVRDLQPQILANLTPIERKQFLALAKKAIAAPEGSGKGKGAG